MTERELLNQAIDARKNSYAPYSHFCVGAALLGKSGKVYLGCNIENATYTPTVCAERVAVFRAVSEGEREFSAIAIVGGGEGEKLLSLCPPCGVCRQVLAEFCPPSFPVILGDETHTETHTLGDLLAFSFTDKELKK